MQVISNNNTKSQKDCNLWSLSDNNCFQGTRFQMLPRIKHIKAAQRRTIHRPNLIELTKHPQDSATPNPITQETSESTKSQKCLEVPKSKGKHLRATSIPSNQETTPADQLSLQLQTKRNPGSSLYHLAIGTRFSPRIQETVSVEPRYLDPTQRTERMANAGQASELTCAREGCIS
uniref:Uncharacterized protein n=1 Tax=Arundo donax TaxID=35708 RepID=A0A0A9DE42_ARUDO